MCGIVGYIGSEPAVPILIEGLKGLDHRGYDSAGISVISDNRIYTDKVVGRAEDLEKKIKSSNILTKKSTIGIGHTRWATHGGITIDNAHPQLNNNSSISIVHNGIIDNASDIRSVLTEYGFKFSSETDTEVIVHLIDYYYSLLKNAKLAVESAINRLKGTYGLAILFSDDQESLIVARNGSPIVIGIGNKEHFIASDTDAIVKYVSKVVYLEDGQLAIITKNSMSIYNKDVIAEPTICALEDSESPATKGQFSHFMIKEIFEQPESIRRCFSNRIRENTCVLGGFNLNSKELSKITSVTIIACGTSYHAGMTASSNITRFAGIPCNVSMASEFISASPILDKNGIYLAISQSGETFDTIDCIKEIQNKGCRVLGVINKVGSTMARLCGAGVYIHAGTEVAVASTKAFTSQLAALNMFAIMLGRSKLVDDYYGNILVEELKKIPSKMEMLLAQSNNIIGISEIINDSPYVLFIGRGLSYPVALEGALKLKEIAYVPCEAYPGGEMKHGPIAMISKNTPVIAINPTDRHNVKMHSNIKEVQSRGARVILITDNKNYADECISKKNRILIPKTVEYFYPFMTTIPLQLIAYNVALIRGLDIDKPRNLAKSVTVG